MHTLRIDSIIWTQHSTFFLGRKFLVLHIALDIPSRTMASFNPNNSNKKTTIKLWWDASLDKYKERITISAGMIPADTGTEHSEDARWQKQLSALRRPWSASRIEIHMNTEADDWTVLLNRNYSSKLRDMTMRCARFMCLILLDWRVKQRIAKRKPNNIVRARSIIRRWWWLSNSDGGCRIYCIVVGNSFVD